MSFKYQFEGGGEKMGMQFVILECFKIICRSGVAIRLDENLLRGNSERCDTYDNAPLAEGGFFDVTILEVFAFD